MSISTQQELDGIRAIGWIVGHVLKEMKHAARAGMTTAELDAIGNDMLHDLGARPAPRLVYNFPGATCISINNEAAHGIPGKRVIREGDLVNIDVSAEKGGFFADNGGTVAVDVTDRRLLRLCESSKAILDKAIAVAKTGVRVNQVGRVIEREARKSGFRVIENLCGHGVGRSLHEEPSEIANYYDPAYRKSFTRGKVVDIETFISTGAHYAVEKGDGWTYITPDGSYVAQYEHTVIVTDDEPIVVTAV